ncbi:NAD-dependent succinate-semialdehyde dehydrogenase [Nocardioides sp.]|uniref:NAD-dependent succinate-semialdehyde dehydrogenase n=1 Tax=Nocardioides sp. TaxID=35761 RepID=UPI00261A6326|nr:NAD-dependent succinate-semialdehyde dehydrogenase [Nocardioides sp.]
MTISPEKYQTPTLPAVPTGLLIGGSWRPATGGATIAVDNPAPGEILAEVADGTEQDGVEALRAAAAAQGALHAMTPTERARLLRRVETELRDRIEEFALLITAEMGKALPEARAEVNYSADFFGWFADEAVRVAGDYRLSPNGSTRILVSHKPVGPCLLITPWNFPLAMGARKIAPALAAGCPSVLKPAGQTPLSSLLLAEVIESAGAPAGAVNVVTTSRSGAVTTAMIETGLARKLSFTGSTAVGKILLGQCARHVMRTSMELGGNAPFLVFEDADLDAAVEGAIVAKMRNVGQACTAANRFIVAAGIAQDFTTRLAARIAAMESGPGWVEGVEVGPLVDDAAVAKFEELLADAVAKGATVVTGGGASSGRFVEPTVLADVAEGSAVLAEEIFGPMAPVVTFTSDAEAVRLANDTDYGLVSYVYTRDLDRTLAMVDHLHTGMVGINVGVVSNAAAPFGGVKESGLGREGGFEGLSEYQDTTYAALPAPRHSP